MLQYLGQLDVAMPSADTGMSATERQYTVICTKATHSHLPDIKENKFKVPCGMLCRSLMDFIINHVRSSWTFTVLAKELSLKPCANDRYGPEWTREQMNAIERLSETKKQWIGTRGVRLFVDGRRKYLAPDALMSDICKRYKADDGVLHLIYEEGPPMEKNTVGKGEEVSCLDLEVKNKEPQELQGPPIGHTSDLGNSSGFPITFFSWGGTPGLTGAGKAAAGPIEAFRIREAASQAGGS